MRTRALAVAALVAGCARVSPAAPSAAPVPRAHPSQDAASSSASPAPVPAPAAPAEVQQILAAKSRAFDIVRSLTDEVGPRLAGSPGDRAAVKWAISAMPENGLTAVHAEKVMVAHWERGTASCEIVSPIRQSLAVAALGGSVATPEAGVDADVMEVASMEALRALAPGAAAGKIVFVNVPTARARDGHGYGESVEARFYGARLAQRAGAVAMVLRSIGTDDNRLPHTGAKSHDEHEIPAGALSNPDADLLHRALAAHGTLRVHLAMTPRTLPDAESADVIGEVRGRERPNEVVVLGAHLDSWDQGTGAIDDGAGVAIVLDAARRIAALPRAPRRTVRVVLYANEEHGREGGDAFAAAMKPNADVIVAALEADMGGDRAFGVRYLGAPEAKARFDAIAAFLAPLGVEAFADAAHAGADISPLRALGVPVIEIRQDASRYFDFHHTANDTLDKVDPDAIAQAASAFAVAAWAAADMEGDLGRVPADQRETKH